MTTTTDTHASAPSAPGLGTSVRPPVQALKTRRRPAMIGLGVALVAISVFGVLFLTSALGQTVQVMAVSTAVPRGQTIEASDLTVVELPGGPTTLLTVPSSDLDSVVGRRADVDLLPGSLLTPDSFVEAMTPSEGSSVVGISLTSLQMPLEMLSAGDTVRIVETPVSQGEAPVEEPRTITATVVSFTASATSDQTIINVEVPRSDAAPLAARAATGRVALILDSPER